MTRLRHIKSLISISMSLGGLAALTLSSTASAQDAPSSPLAGIYACKDKVDPTERLACYDAAVGIIATKEANKEIVTIDAAASETIQREAFGFSLPSLPKLGLPSFGGSKDGTSKSSQSSGPKAQEFPVKRVAKGRDGVLITMENGQIWRGVNGRLNYIPKGDLVATIRKASMGSYRLSLSNGRETVRGLGVRRVE